MIQKTSARWGKTDITVFSTSHILLITADSGFCHCTNKNRIQQVGNTTVLLNSAFMWPHRGGRVKRHSAVFPAAGPAQGFSPAFNSDVVAGHILRTSWVLPGGGHTGFWPPLMVPYSQFKRAHVLVNGGSHEGLQPPWRAPTTQLQLPGPSWLWLAQEYFLIETFVWIQGSY